MTVGTPYGGKPRPPELRIVHVVQMTARVGITKRPHKQYWVVAVINDSFEVKFHIKRDVYEYLKERGTPCVERAYVSERDRERAAAAAGGACECGHDRNTHAKAVLPAFCLDDDCDCKAFESAQKAKTA